MNISCKTNKNVQIYFIIFLFILSSLYLGSFTLTNHNLINNQIKNKKNNASYDLVNSFIHQNNVQNVISNNQITIPFSGFIKNVGQQANSAIEYYYNSQSSSIAFLSSEVIYAKTYNTAFSVNFIGSNIVHPTGISQTDHLINYFTGNERIMNVPSFQEVWYHNLYDNIDLRYYNSEKGLKYEFLVYPGGNPANIKMKYSDNVILQITPAKIEVTKGQVLFSDTDLVAYSTSLSNNNPYSISSSSRVDLSFKTVDNNNIIGFEIGSFDLHKLLIIDPLIVGFTTFIGGSNGDNSRSIVVDTMGNTYITGTTSSTDFPVNVTTLDTTENGYVDVFITKLNAFGNGIIYSTYLGGTSNDEGYAIDVDSSGNAYVTGYTQSTDFPVSTNAYHKGRYDVGATDVFVSKLNSTGNGLDYSTYIGGSDFDYSYSLAVDSTGNLFVLGDTLSSNFPVNTSSFDSSFNGGRDTFIAKFNSTGNGLLYCTFLGGSSNEWSQSLKIDNSDNAYVTGNTYSSNFPVNNSAFESSFNGGAYDIFVSKLNSTGNGLVYSTFIGGSGGEQANSLFLDSNNDVYLTGFTTSTDFPVINAFDPSYNSGGGSGYDAFVVKLNSTGNGLDFSSYLGGTNDEAGNSIAVDNSGNIYVTGYTYSTDFPVTSDTLQSNNNGGTDAFLSEFTSTGSSLVASTYVGGSVNDYGNSLVLDSLGNIFITGQTFSSDFPSNSSASGSSYTGSGDAFISKLMFSPDITISNPTNNSFYNNHLIDLIYSVSDPNLDTAKIYIDGIVNASSILSGSILNDPTGLADGMHNLTIIASNTLGLVSVKQIIFTIDTVAPIITITSPIVKSYGSNTITLSYTVSGQSSLDIFIDGTKNTSALASGANLPSFLDGLHNVTLVGTDLSGNYASKTILFTVDTTPPNLSITSPENTTYSDGFIVLTYSISDLSSYTTLVYMDGVVNTSLRNSGSQYSLADGSHYITIVVTDFVGNSVNKIILFTVDTTPPNLSITSPENTTYSNGSIVVAYSISDMSSYTTLIYMDGVTNTSLRNNGSQYSLADGSHNITIVVTDFVGNSVSKTVLFTVMPVNTNPSSSDTTQPVSSSQSQSNSSNQTDTSKTSSTTIPGFDFFEIMVCVVGLLYYQIFKTPTKKKR